MPTLDIAQETLRHWVRDYTNELFSWAKYKVSNAEIAEDLVQETFLAACRGFANFEQRSSPKTWLFSILNRKIYDHYRSKYRQVAEEQPAEREEAVLLEHLFSEGHWKPATKPTEWEEDTPNLLDDSEFQEALAACLGRLPQKWRMAIECKYLTEKDSTLICQELGVSATNFWQILHRAKLQLRQCLTHNWFSE
jgi:RNA polymerase sigma-70 factor (ECF subfamily)